MLLCSPNIIAPAIKFDHKNDNFVKIEKVACFGNSGMK
jgi:hypothetical protein